MTTLRIKLLSAGARLPTRGTAGSAGYDIYAAPAEPVTIAPGQTLRVPSGFAMALETGYAAFIYARSGLGINHGIIPANCVGVIDSDYRGEVVVGLRNCSDACFSINPGDRIAQMVISKCETPELCVCDELEETRRGSGGFGSSGR